MSQRNARRRYFKQLEERNDVLTSSPREHPLTEWQLAFAEWLVRQDSRPTQAEQAAMASKLADKPVSTSFLRVLKRRDRFVEYSEQMRTSGLKRARAKLEAHAAKAIDAHLRGIDMALAASDYKAIPAFTTPILDRVAPKNDRPDQAAQVNINITTGQAEGLQAALDAEVVEAECERLPDE